MMKNSSETRLEEAQSISSDVLFGRKYKRNKISDR